MLVFLRKIGESVVINGHIYITVTRSAEGELELAIDAPRDVPVDRLEIHKRKEMLKQVS